MDLLGNVLLVDKGGRSRLAREALGVNFGFFLFYFVQHVLVLKTTNY